MNITFLVSNLLDPNAPLPVEEMKLAAFSEDDVEKLSIIKQSVLAHQNSQTKLVAMQQKHQEDSVKQTYHIITELKERLSDTLKESKRAQTLTTWMYSLIFLLGFVLIGIAVYFGIQGKDVLSIAFGTIGFGTLVAQLLADPPLKLQDARSNYAQLTIASLVWFDDFLNSSGLLVANQQAYVVAANATANTGSLARIKKEFDENHLTISRSHLDNTAKVLRLIDEVAEPGKGAKEV